MAVLIPALALARPGASDSLLEEAHTLAASAGTTAEAEGRLQQVVLQLATYDETADSRALIEGLATRAPRVMVRHEEGNALVPYADVGAAARYVLRQWDRRNAFGAALRHGRSGDAQLLNSYFAGNAAQRAGILDAVGKTPAHSLEVFRDAVATSISTEDGDRLAAEFARALTDIGLFATVISEGRAAVALATLGQLEQALDAPAALQVLQTALQRPEIASAALFAIGRLRTELAAADELIWQKLADPALGATAAAVLARDADRHTIERLRALTQQSGVLRQRALLALRLSGASSSIGGR